MIKKCNRTTGICFSCAGHHAGENCTGWFYTVLNTICDLPSVVYMGMFDPQDTIYLRQV